ncbi:MAG: hypothetical protein PHW04_02270 [Candidatus Wallbacteria bacterium]|nr:hypothetical protein [Candidatus Wallbacteria bacterium]
MDNLTPEQKRRELIANLRRDLAKIVSDCQSIENEVFNQLIELDLNSVPEEIFRKVSEFKGVFSEFEKESAKKSRLEENENHWDQLEASCQVLKKRLLKFQGEIQDQFRGFGDSIFMNIVGCRYDERRMTVIHTLLHEELKKNSAELEAFFKQADFISIPELDDVIETLQRKSLNIPDNVRARIGGKIPGILFQVLISYYKMKQIEVKKSQNPGGFLGFLSKVKLNIETWCIDSLTKHYAEIETEIVDRNLIELFKTPEFEEKAEKAKKIQVQISQAGSEIDAKLREMEAFLIGKGFQTYDDLVSAIEMTAEVLKTLTEKKELIRRKIIDELPDHPFAYPEKIMNYLDLKKKETLLAAQISTLQMDLNNNFLPE